MHFDLAHALVSGVLVWAIIIIAQRTDLLGKLEKGSWNWKVFAAIFVVIFLLNIVWPVS